MSVNARAGLPDVFEGRARIVVLAPHPDDESLGCGALLARAFAGAGAHVICLTDGSASHPGSTTWNPARLAAQRRAEMIEALRLLGGTASDLTWIGERDGQLYRADTVGIAADLVPIIAATGAQHVFAPAVEDHHQDHRETARIAAHVQARRPDWTYYSYPVWSRWDDPDFARNVAGRSPMHVALGDWHTQKRAAIGAHRSQLGRVVPDDPQGFIMAPAFVEKFCTEDELFWRVP